MVARTCRALGARPPSTAYGYACVSTASYGNGVRGHTHVLGHTTTDSDGRRPCVICERRATCTSPPECACGAYGRWVLYTCVYGPRSGAGA
jgi:hypothetical protein